MRYLYNGKQAKNIDFHAIHTMGIPGLVLMERAAMSVAAVVMEKEEKEETILVVCGTGNNGGDGVATARILHEAGYPVAVTVVGESKRMTEDMKRQLAIAANMDIPIVPFLSMEKGNYDVILDALFGIGLSRPLTDVYERVVDVINKSGAKVYSLDIPSGIDAESGAVLGTAVKADCTVTFGVNKIGLVLYPGCEYAGEVFITDIGFPAASVNAEKSFVYHYERVDLASQLPQRPRDSHKGTFGKVLCIAGCETMCGAAFLAAKAAYTMGAGLVKVLSAPCNRNPLLTALPEILFGERDELEESLAWADAVVIGPGLGMSKEAEHMVQYVIQNSSVPTVIDGDGIRMCREVTDTLSDRFILTPHRKELSYLTGIPIDELKKDSLRYVQRAALEWNCIIAGKDARTIVSDGRECYVNVSGNNGMATGGSGDVLAGMLGGLLGQHMEPFEAAKLAVFLHGLSGDFMAGKKSKYGLLASDLIAGIPEVLCEYGGVQ